MDFDAIVKALEAELETSRKRQGYHIVENLKLTEAVRKAEGRVDAERARAQYARSNLTKWLKLARKLAAASRADRNDPKVSKALGDYRKAALKGQD